MKRRLLEQNGAKMMHSSKLPDTALPCHTLARPCQAFRHRHSQPALASSSQTIEIRGRTIVPGELEHFGDFSLKNLVLEACWSQEEALKRTKSLEDLLKHHFNLVFNLVSLLHYEQFMFLCI
ncbi:hypothetical protein HanPI659440_Chr10g0385611 [Helianthus annuus]|nr:hypothetical protein HanPI659440_Chr10g0385611 [Helianthus annuus]